MSNAIHQLIAVEKEIQALIEEQITLSSMIGVHTKSLEETQSRMIQIQEFIAELESTLVELHEELNEASEKEAELLATYNDLLNKLEEAKNKYRAKKDEQQQIALQLVTKQ